jgi:hypothetical protein
MTTFRIACAWSMYGEFEVEANTLEEAIAKVEDSLPPYNALPPADSQEYVDDSFRIDKYITRQMNEETEDEQP